MRKKNLTQSMMFLSNHKFKIHSHELISVNSAETLHMFSVN